uniref:Uncharacterized protein n=1 Tax=Eutreptiella gymnastica TaxID=73025 RepID=A0A7S1J6F6_9EUGL|mmetsp:Transcript_71358/g.125635  ORF Transcript_71358/g.125635 Transcript_71358/m.125635 type:complete len:873 (+) Transcript_71358:28-2646(+)
MTSNQDLAEIYRELCWIAGGDDDPVVLSALKGVQRSTMRTLDLTSANLAPSGTSGTGTGAKFVWDTLRDCSALEHLGLRCTSLQGTSIPDLVMLVAELPNLMSLDLSENKIAGLHPTQALMQLARTHKKLVKMNLNDTGIAQPAQEHIEAQLEEKKAAASKTRTLSPVLPLSPNPPSRPLEPTASSPARPVSAAAKKSVRKVSCSDGVVAVKGPNSLLHSPAKPGSARTGAQKVGSLGSDYHFLETPLDYNKLTHIPKKIVGAERKALSKDDIRCKQLQIDVIGIEDRMVQFTTELPNYCAKKKKDSDSRWQSAQNTMADLYRYEMSISDGALTEIQWGREVGLVADPSMIQTMNLRYNMAATAVADPLMLTVAKEVVEREGAVQLTPQQMDHHVPCLDSEMVEAIRTLDQIYKTNPITTETVMASLAQSQEILTRLQKRTDAVECSRMEAIDDDDLMRAESYHDESIKVQTQLSKVVMERILALQQPGEEINLFAVIDTADQVAHERIHLNREQALADAQLLQGDIAKLETAVEAKHREQRSQLDDFLAFEQRTEGDLLSNADKQQKVWDTILSACADLVRHVEARRSTVTRYLEDRERHDRYKGDAEHWLQLAEHRHSQLQKLLGAAGTQVGLLNNMELALGKTADIIRERLHLIKGEVDRVLTDEQKLHFMVFRRQYLTIGELLYKKAQRLEELEKMIDQNNFQIGFAKEALDPNVNMYKMHTLELTKVKEELLIKVDYLKDRADEAASMFEPTEQALKEHGVDFVHPAVELQEILVERKQKANELRHCYFNVQQSKNSLAKADISQQATILKQVKSTGIIQLLPPLSPPRTSSTPSPALPALPGIEARSARPWSAAITAQQDTGNVLD